MLHVCGESGLQLLLHVCAESGIQRIKVAKSVLRAAGAAAPNLHEIARYTSAAKLAFQSGLYKSFRGVAKTRNMMPMLRGNRFFFSPRAAPRLKLSFLKHLCGETAFFEQCASTDSRALLFHRGFGFLPFPLLLSALEAVLVQSACASLPLRSSRFYRNFFGRCP